MRKMENHHKCSHASIQDMKFTEWYNEDTFGQISTQFNILLTIYTNCTASGSRSQYASSLPHAIFPFLEDLICEAFL